MCELQIAVVSLLMYTLMGGKYIISTPRVNILLGSIHIIVYSTIVEGTRVGGVLVVYECVTAAEA